MTRAPSGSRGGGALSSRTTVTEDSGSRPALSITGAARGPEGAFRRGGGGGTSRFLRDAVCRALSSPSTRSSVSSSSRWTAPFVRTMATSFSPATMPSAMRMASLARWDRRGSSEMVTRTEWSPAPRLIEGQEALGAVDDVGEHHEAAVGGALGERQPALLAAVGAYERLGPALGQFL